MARHNQVLLYGQVCSDPKIYSNDDGDLIRGVCAIQVIRGIRDYGDNISFIKFDNPLIMSGNPKLIEKMKLWKEHDMVEVKGLITTKDVSKQTECNSCGTKNSFPGNVVFVTPIYVSVRETNITKKEGQELLKERMEISNMVQVIGTLCREPETLYTDKKTCITQYPIAINRKFKIMEDGSDIKTDFPWVKSYAETAERDRKVLTVNSSIFVDGMLQSRDIERKTVCSNCGNTYTWNDSVLEIVPYKNEYLNNCLSEEDLLKREALENAAIADDILKS